MDFKLFAKKHNVILGMTGSGKTTLLKEMFLANYHKKSFRVHFKPDPDRMILYKALGLKFVKTKEEVIEAYLYGKDKRIVWDIESRFVTGIDPYDEFLICASTLLQYKELIMRDGTRDTHELYLFMDEAQHSMSPHSIPSELEDVILEGRKYKLWLIIVTQRPALINMTAKTQSNLIVGYMEDEIYFEKTYKKYIPKEMFLFVMKDINRQYYLLRSTPTTIREQKKRLKEDY